MNDAAKHYVKSLSKLVTRFEDIAGDWNVVNFGMNAGVDDWAKVRRRFVNASNRMRVLCADTDRLMSRCPNPEAVVDFADTRAAMLKMRDEMAVRIVHFDELING